MPLEFVAASNQYVDFGNPAALDITGDEITLSIWLCCPNGAEGKVLAKWSDAGADFSYLLSVLANGHAQFVTNTGANDVVEGTTDLDDGELHHVAGTYDGAILRLYVDSVEEGTTAASGNLTSTTAPVRIGAGSGGVGTENPFDGTLDDPRIYARAPSADEILTIYNSRGRDGIALGLAGRWLLNEGAPGVVASGAGVIKDSGPNGLDGTPANSPTWASGQLASRRRTI